MTEQNPEGELANAQLLRDLLASIPTGVPVPVEQDPSHGFDAEAQRAVTRLCTLLEAVDKPDLVSSVADVLRSEPERFLAVTSAAHSANLDVAPLVAVLAQNLRLVMKSPALSPSLLSLLVEHVSPDDPASTAFVRYLAKWFSEDPEGFEDVLSQAALRFLSPATLAVVLALPGFDIRRLGDRVARLLAVQDVGPGKEPEVLLSYEPGVDGEVLGCFDYIGKRTGPVCVTGSHTAGWTLPGAILDFSCDTFYQIVGDSVVYITFQPVGWEIVPTGYAVMTAQGAGNGEAPTTWQLLASRDNKQWVVLHDVVESRVLCEDGKVKVWNLPGIWDKFRYFRFIQYRSGNKEPVLKLAGFELFGLVYDVSEALSK